MIDARFNVSMQQEPGFAARPYLKTRSFRLAGPCSMLVETFLNKDGRFSYLLCVG